MAERRRLPVLQQPKKPAGEDADDETRPPWHWVGFGTVVIFAAWLPLTYIAQVVVARVLAQRFGADLSEDQMTVAVASLDARERFRLMATLALPHSFALGMASFAGGFLVGRFGARTTMREAAWAGAATAFVATALSCRSLGGSWTSAIIVVIAVGFAAWGGRVGTKLKAVKKA